MNREIKFRAFHTGLNRMFSWEEMQSDNISVFNQNNPSYKIMQYTGLKDKNGKEIYENDKVACHAWESVDPFPSGVLAQLNKIHFTTIDRVYWNNGWVVKDEKGKEVSLTQFNEICEVVGNIYQNPELLNN